MSNHWNDKGHKALLLEAMGHFVSFRFLFIELLSDSSVFPHRFS